MLQLWLLGQFDVKVDGKRVVIPTRAAQSMLAFLALNPGIPQRREKLAGMLWPEMSDENARSNLRNQLWRLRKALTSPQTHRPRQEKPLQDQYILAEEFTIAFNPDADYWLDVAQLARATLPDDGTSELSGQLALYRGELLPGFYDDWVLLERERLHGTFESKMQGLLERLIDEKRWQTVAEWAERWIALGQTPEPAYRALIVTHAAQGNLSQAVLDYERCVKALREDLGVEPSADTRALYEAFVKAGGAQTIPWQEDFADTQSLLELVSLQHRSRTPGARRFHDEPPAPGQAPFKGLQYFDESDADRFFGRELLTAKLVGHLRESRFLAVVVGASGSGKSSIVRAGVIPALRRGELLADGSLPPGDSQNWRIHVITPTAHPLLALATHLTRNIESVTATATLIDDFAREPRSLYLYLRRQMDDQQPSAANDPQPPVVVPQVLLVIDQFEELFTLCHDELEREQFVDNLMTAVSDQADELITLILAIRADFYAHLAQYPELRDAVARHQEYIGPMTVEELRRAIQEPAKQHLADDGLPWEFEPGVVDLILRDVGSEPGALPLLSHALLETWKRRSGHVLTLKGYADAGGVLGAIAQTAETLYQDLTIEQQVIVRNIFLRLTELGEGTEDTRRRASFKELLPRKQDTLQVRTVLTKLADARLITTSANTAEVAHEALIREWDRLRDWLNENREALKLHRQLTEAAHDWELLERDAGALYRGTRLAQAQAFASQAEVGSNPNALNEQERAFLDASMENEKREEQEREEARQRELLAKEHLLQVEQLQLARERTVNQKLHRRAILLAAALVLSLALVGIALFLGNQAQSSARVAQQQQRIATARELAASAIGSLESDPERSLLLASEAISETWGFDQTTTTEAEDALRRALQASRLEKTLRGHSGWVEGVAFSPDGTRLATAGHDKTVKVWNAATGQEVMTLFTNAERGQSGIAFSPDGTRLAAPGAVGTAKVWDLATGQELFTLSGHTDWVSNVAFSPDGKRLATASEDRTASVWDAATGQELLSLRGHSGSVAWVTFSPDGTHLVTASQDGTAKLWDTLTGESLLTFHGHTNWVNSVAFSPDGKRLVTAGGDGTAIIWDASNGTRLIELRGHTLAVARVAISPDGTRVATTSLDGTTKVWDSITGQELLTLRGHTDAVIGVAFSPGCESAPHAMAGRCGTHLATTSWDGTAKVWNLSLNQELLALSVPDPLQASVDYFAVAVSPDGEQLAAGFLDGTITLWDISNALDGKSASGEEIQTLSGHTDGVRRLTFSPDGTRLATASQDRTARVWDLATGEEIRTLRGHMEPVWTVAFSPDGKKLATVGQDETVKVWDLTASSKEPLYTFPIDAWSDSVAFSPDGTLLAAGIFDSTTLVWDLVSGVQVHTLRGHTAEVYTIAYSADGKRLATAGADGNVKVWDTTTGGEVLSISAHLGDVNDISFSPHDNGAHLVTSGQDGTVKLWNATNGKQVLTFPGQTGPAWIVRFSPACGNPPDSFAESCGMRLFTAGLDRTIRFYLVSVQDLMALARTRVTRTWTIDECERYLHLSQAECADRSEPVAHANVPMTPSVAAAAQPAAANGKVCEVTDAAGLNDQFLSQLAYKGVQEAAEKFGWASNVIESKTRDDYEKNIAQFLGSDCDLIVTPFLFAYGAPTKNAAKANPHQKFVMVETETDPPMDNLWSQWYATDQAAFLAGYVAASVTRTGKVGTFGGLNIQPVTDFMNGFALGVGYYNEKYGTNVRVLGWDPATQQGLFTEDFENPAAGRKMAERLLTEGADIILPVAGRTGTGAAGIIRERGNAYLIGVDSDWTVTYPEFQDIVLTSVEKKLDVSIVLAVQSIVDGTFKGGAHIGTLENGQVGLSPFHNLDALISARVKADLEQIKSGIIAGKITTEPAN